MTVNLLDLKAQNDALDAELRAAFERVLRSGHFILGPEVEKFERDLAAFAGARHALGVSSGTDALLLALMALDIGPGDEVLCPSFTFFATAGCVARLGATPVLCDSLPSTFNLDVRDAARRITPRTRAIIPVHLFGQAADMDAVMALAAKHNLRVIEDAAQALGAAYRERPVGTIGAGGVASFFPTKNLGALGDAGALVMQDTALFDRARILRVHGMEPKYHHEFIGGNFRIDALQAALLAVKLPHAAAYTAARRRNAECYNARLAALPDVRTAGPADDAASAAEAEAARLVLPAALPGNDVIWNQYTLRVPGAGRRDALRVHLAARGIGSEIYYPVPLHEQKCFALLGYAPEDLPWAHRLAGEVLSLPIYPELPEAQLQEVCAAIQEFLGLPQRHQPAA
jgi:dTDP-4-amino-4,6-dideoxygalactose transaminase